MLQGEGQDIVTVHHHDGTCKGVILEVYYFNANFITEQLDLFYIFEEAKK